MGKFDESMLIAVPAALAKSPDARGEFDHMAVEQLNIEISKMVAGQEAILCAAKPGEEQCEAAVRQAHDILSKAKDGQKVSANNYIASSQRQAASDNALSVAKASVLEMTKATIQLKKGVEEAEADLQIFQQGPKETFNTLRARAEPRLVNIEEMAAPLPSDEQALEAKEPEVPVIAVC